MSKFNQDIFDKIFSRTKSILVSRYEVESTWIDEIVKSSDELIDTTKRRKFKETNKLAKQFRLFRETDLRDFKSFFSVKSTVPKKKKLCREYIFQFFDSENELLLRIDLSNDNKLWTKDGLQFNIGDVENFRDWLSKMIEHFDGLTKNEIIACNVFSHERKIAIGKRPPFRYTSKEWDAITKMGEYIEEYYVDKEIGRDEYEKDDTPSCCLDAIIWEPIEYPGEKGRYDDTIFVTDTRKPLGKGELYKNCHTEERICSKTGDWCKNILFGGKKRHKVDLARYKRNLIQEQVRLDHNKKKFPLPLYFCTQYNWFEYIICDEYTIGFELKELFGLFLAFKLRNTPSTELHYWLDYFYEKEGELFVAYLSKIRRQYKFLFKGRKDTKKEIKRWIGGEKFRLKRTSSGFKKIELEQLDETQVDKFFTFLYKETNGTETPFLTKEEVTSLMNFGFSLPPKSPETTFDLQLVERSAKNPGIIGYCFYRLCEYGAFSAKGEVALFLQNNFKFFRTKTIKQIKEYMRRDKPAKMKFDIENYLP